MKPNDSLRASGAALPAVATATRRADDPGAPFPVEVRLSARAMWAAIVIFLALIALPGVVRELSGDRVGPVVAAIFRPGPVPVVERLRAVEQRVDDGAWIGPIRRWMQTALFRSFREGNRKVLVGRDGWLFHRPGVQALTGRGPVLGPTHSVAKDPSLKQWEGPIPVIRDFAAQLNERGIRLVLVPVPDKAAMLADHLRGSPTHPPPTRLRHPDWERLVASLDGHVQVIDLADPVPYLPDDTHWEPAGARSAAAAIAVSLRPEATAFPKPEATHLLRGQGDLVDSLGLAERMADTFQTTVEALSAPPVESDPSAPIVLLGDSNVNMYDDPSLPFYQRGAGFGSWLSACLNERLHVIAINGGGATQVRQRFAALPDDVVRGKKLVVWVLAERDLLMDPVVAHANGVEWKRVVFNPHASAAAGPAAPGDALVVEATLRAKSKVLDMASVNYPDAAFTAEFTVDRIISGTYTETELAVVLWNFRQRTVQPAARLTPGQKVRLTLAPWLAQGELTKTNLEDDFQRFDLPLLYAEKLEIIGE